MNNTKEQVFQLFIEKLSGSIGLEEGHALEERLSSDPEFRGEWQRLEERASELGMRAFLSELDAEAGLRENADAAARTSPIRPSRTTSWAVILVPFFLSAANNTPARTRRAAMASRYRWGLAKSMPL